MSVQSVTCPRCEGDGLIRVMVSKHPGGKGSLVEADCPRCRGTGQASWSELMGDRVGERQPEQP